jgi:site-specific recombinase XerD
MQQGGDVYKLSRLLGHESVSTTERYLRAFRSRDARLTSRSVLDNL